MRLGLIFTRREVPPPTTWGQHFRTGRAPQTDFSECPPSGGAGGQAGGRRLHQEHSGQGSAAEASALPLTIQRPLQSRRQSRAAAQQLGSMDATGTGQAPSVQRPSDRLEVVLCYVELGVKCGSILSTAVCGTFSLGDTMGTPAGAVVER